MEKKLKDDNDVYRCQDCGYIFSPAASPQNAADHSGGARTTAVQSGYPAQS